MSHSTAVRHRSLVLVVAAAAACGRAHDAPARACGPQARVLIEAAHEDELDPVLAGVTDPRNVRVGGTAYTCGELAGRPVVLGLLGIGPVRAARSAEHAVADFAPSAVIVVGIAGGISHELHVADVAIPARWARHDERDTAWFSVDPALLAAARSVHPVLRRCDEAQVCATAPGVDVGGNGVTGATFVADPAVGEELRERLGADVTDMETAAVASVAHRREVPFVAIRAVSDLVRTGRSHEHVERYGGVAAGNAATAAIELVRALP